MTDRFDAAARYLALSLFGYFTCETEGDDYEQSLEHYIEHEVKPALRTAHNDALEEMAQSFDSEFGEETAEGNAVRERKVNQP